MALLFVFSVYVLTPHPSLLDSEAVPRKGGQEKPQSLSAGCGGLTLVSLSAPCLTPSPEPQDCTGRLGSMVSC